MPEIAALTRRFEAADERREFRLGHERYVSIHFLGADQYATT